MTIATAAALTAVPAGTAAAAGAFWDDDGSVHEQSIEGIAAPGVTVGCDPPFRSSYCPSDEVPRGQMAAFLARALDLPPASEDHFRDDDTSIFEDAINRIAAQDITTGCNPPANDEFCPDATVSREQMAAFLARAYQPPEADEDHFDDDDGSIFEDAINRIAAAGITVGCNPPDSDRYCPHAGVTRAQMATFLVRSDDELVPLDPARLHERTVTYQVDVYDDDADAALLPLLERRAAEAMYAAVGWNIRHRLLLEQVEADGDFTVLLTAAEDVGGFTGCSTAYSCTVGDLLLINQDNLLDPPDAWADGDLGDYQRYLVLHEVGHWLDFDDTADEDDDSHYNDEAYCFDVDGDGLREAPVMKQQSISTGDCVRNVAPLPFERDCVEEAWLTDSTDQGDGDGDDDDQCPHTPVGR